MTGPWIAAIVALWAVVILLGFLVLGTLRRLAPVLERAEASLRVAAGHGTVSGLPPGTLVPRFVASEISGDRFTDADLRGSRTIVLLLGSSCRACERFVADLVSGSVPNFEARLVVVADNPVEAREFVASGATVLVQEDESLARVFESDRVPHAFVIGNDGRVLASGWPNDWDGLQNLLSEETGGDRESEIAAAAVAS
jgi:hypothetical protein